MMRDCKSKRPKILVTMANDEIRKTFIPSEIYDEIEKLGDVEWNNTMHQFEADELKERLQDKDVCISGWGCKKFDENVLSKANRLGLIAHTGGSVAALVSDAMYEKGIRIVSANDCFAESVAEGVIAYILAALRDIPFWNSEVHNGNWKTSRYYNEGLLDRTIGLVGYGATVKHLIKLLKPFRTEIKVCSRYLSAEEAIKNGIKSATLDEVFSTCSIISLHVSQRPDTYNMVNEALLKKIKDGGLLINTARGSIVDEEALVRELENGRFKAVLDVFKDEPLPLDSKLRSLKDVILIPHMAGPTVDRRKYCTIMAIEEVKRFLKGEQLEHEIDRSYANNMTR